MELGRTDPLNYFNHIWLAPFHLVKKENFKMKWLPEYSDSYIIGSFLGERMQIKLKKKLW